MQLATIFPHTDRSGWRDWSRYLACRIVGHRIETDMRGHLSCARCHDTMLSHDPRQP